MGMFYIRFFFMIKTKIKTVPDSPMNDLLVYHIFASQDLSFLSCFIIELKTKFIDFLIKARDIYTYMYMYIYIYIYIYIIYI